MKKLIKNCLVGAVALIAFFVTVAIFVTVAFINWLALEHDYALSFLLLAFVALLVGTVIEEWRTGKPSDYDYEV